MIGSWLVSSTPTVMGSGTLETAFEKALAFAESVGVRVPESGRHRQALKLMRRFNQGALNVRLANRPLLLRLSAAHRTAWEGLLILCAASLRRRSRSAPFTLDKLNMIMGGGEIVEREDTRARDAQFELYIAALLALAGADVQRGEPDLRFRYGYELVGIAAKRIRSAKAAQVRRNLSKAVDQIERSGLRGWIGLNLDARFMTIQAGRRGQSKLLAAFNNAFNSVNSALEPFVGNPQVLGVMLYGYTGQWIETSKQSRLPQLSSSSPFRWHGWVTDPGEQMLYNDFVQAWHSRLNSRFDSISRGHLECS
jgi:hypothetical protein